MIERISDILIVTDVDGTLLREADAVFREEIAAALEQENADLQEDIEALGSAQSVQEIAKESLGLVDPDTVIIKPNS